MQKGSICKLSGLQYPFFKRKSLQMQDTRTMNPYFAVDFRERDACTRLLASVGLAQARPNYVLLIILMGTP